jgi:hypothetical protein
MDLIREILLFAEKHCNSKSEDGVRIKISSLPKRFHKIEVAELWEHVNLTFERGLIMGKSVNDYYMIYRLTWDGHEFLDNARSPKVWEAAKKVAGQVSFATFVSILTRVAVDHGLELLKSKSPELLEMVSDLAGLVAGSGS